MSRFKSKTGRRRAVRDFQFGQELQASRRGCGSKRISAKRRTVFAERRPQKLADALKLFRTGLACGSEQGVCSTLQITLIRVRDRAIFFRAHFFRA